MSRSVSTRRVTQPGLGTEHLPGVHQRNYCLPEPLSLQAVHGSSPIFRGSWCLDGAAEAAPGDITEPHFLSHHQSLSLGSTSAGMNVQSTVWTNTHMCKAPGSQPYTVLPCTSSEPSSEPSFLLQQVVLEEISKVHARLLS